jgi:formylglycine-generating enzyme required for sulfatase activity
MVKVGACWIDAYEMSACPGSGAVGGPTGGDEMGGATTTAAACSVTGTMPQSTITWFQAAQMCANAGKRLCTNAEWQTAASGTPDPGADGGATGCNVNSNGGMPAPTGSHTDCVSRFGAYDMAGNLWEWVAAWHGMAWFAELLPRAPVTRTQVELMQVDTVASPQLPGFADFGIAPRSVEETLPVIVRGR